MSATLSSATVLESDLSREISAEDDGRLSPEVQAVIQSAMMLPLKDRQTVVAFIEHSLDEELPPLSPQEFREAWSAELQRRLDDYDSGRDPGFSEEEIRAKVQALLGQRP